MAKKKKSSKKKSSYKKPGPGRAKAIFRKDFKRLGSPEGRKILASQAMDYVKSGTVNFFEDIPKAVKASQKKYYPGIVTKPKKKVVKKKVVKKKAKKRLVKR